MTKVKKLLLVVLSILALFFLFAIWYKYTYSMDRAEAFQVNAIESPSKLLIATQGSDFKNTVTQEVVNHYKSDSVFVNVIDVSALNEISIADYDAILVIHTWEYEKPPAVVASFMEKMKSNSDNIVMMTTSGPGTSKMEGVDAITGESKLEDAPRTTAQIIKKLNPLLSIEL